MYKDFNTKDLGDLVDSDAIQTSIRNIISIERNELLGMPEFGNKIKPFLFETMDIFTIANVNTIITSVLYKYEKRITNIEVNITTEPAMHKIICRISYDIKESDTKDNIVIRLK